MSGRRVPLIALLGIGVMAAGALAGCAGDVTPSVSPVPGPSFASPSPDAVSSKVSAAWLDGGAAIAVITWGSSSCVPRSVEAPAVSNGVVTVRLSDAAATVCTKDLVPRATFVPLPAGVDPTQGLRVDVAGAAEGAAELAGLSAPTRGADFAPSAGWAGDSLVAILTWGSSSCVPSVETVAETTSGRVAITFAAPPENQVCTLDIGPQVSVADLRGFGGTGETTLELSGDGLAPDTPVRVEGRR